MTTRRALNAPTLAEIRKWPATVSVADAARALGVSKSHLHALIRSDESPVKVLSFRSAYRVVTADLVNVLSGEREAA
ncbi:hypothetical protein [Streptomyces albus]|uniref:hypothetical protein n=1 Tax=Streptomyces sp. NRRL F-5917 TaxID=1463873 RepID=UPI0004C074F0|nr:hypothetical protein [Streptomyces sp. NRRL F-5917]